MADLLRKADGSYVTFNQSIAVAGLRLELLKASSQPGGLAAAFRVRFCGLVAAGSHLLAFGYAEQTLHFRSFRVAPRRVRGPSLPSGHRGFFLLKNSTGSPR